MKYLLFVLTLFFVSCGTSLTEEESEADRIQDSIKAEEDRASSIENANDFIVIGDSL